MYNIGIVGRGFVGSAVDFALTSTDGSSNLTGDATLSGFDNGRASWTWSDTGEVLTINSLSYGSADNSIASNDGEWHLVVGVYGTSAQKLYIDNIVTYNAMPANHSNRIAFCLSFDEFNIQTNSASNNTTSNGILFNTLLIPNENRNINNFFTSVTHKAKKFNYLQA